jgi:hypothetical protein
MILEGRSMTSTIYSGHNFLRDRLLGDGDAKSMLKPTAVRLTREKPDPRDHWWCWRSEKTEWADCFAL